MFNVSVGIVTYNCASQIETCLRSVLRQSLPPTEIIIVDNGSVDETLSQIEKLLQSAGQNNFKLIRNDENNVASARDRIIKESSGEWVAMTDPDCIVPTTWLENYGKYLRENPHVKVIGGGNRVVVRSAFLLALDMMSEFFLGHMNSTQLRYSFPTGPVDQIPTCNIVYHRNSALAVGSFNSKFRFVCEDVELNHRLKKSVGFLFFLNDNIVLHDHRRSIGSWLKRLFQFGFGHWGVITHSPDYFSWRQGLPILGGLIALFILGMGGSLLWLLALGALIQFLCCFWVCFRRDKYLFTPILFSIVSLGQLAYVVGNISGFFSFLKHRVSSCI